MVQEASSVPYFFFGGGRFGEGWDLEGEGGWARQ